MSAGPYSPRLMQLGRRLQSAVAGLVNYGNPLEIAFRRALAAGTDLMTITDRRTGISVLAAAGSYQMFGETWYKRDYDVPGCPLRAGDVVIDIGANQGFYTCYAAVQGATVYAYEPHPGSFERLKENVVRNHFGDLVLMSQQAVGASAGSATMRCFDELGGGLNSIVPSHLPDAMPNAVVDVDVLDPNSILRAIGKQVRICKLDCEGAELDIIKAIEDPAQIDAFAMEFHPQAYAVPAVVDVMRQWGTHQLSFSPQCYVLYAVANAVLDDYAAGGYLSIHGR